MCLLLNLWYVFISNNFGKCFFFPSLISLCAAVAEDLHNMKGSGKDFYLPCMQGEITKQCCYWVEKTQTVDSVGAAENQSYFSGLTLLLLLVLNVLW